MKTFEEIVYGDYPVDETHNKPEATKKPLLYSVLGIIFSFAPLFNILGIWLSVKSIEDYNWQGRKSYLGWIALVFNLVSIFVVAAFIIYVFIIYPEFKDPCEGLQAGKYIAAGEKFTCS